MAAFILLFLPLKFPAGFRSYDWVPHIGVISSSQTCLSAGPDNCTERRAGREGGRVRTTGVGGRYRRTDLSYILISSGLLSLIWCIFINGRTQLWLFFISQLLLSLPELICRARVCERDGKINIWTVRLNSRVTFCVPYRLQNQNVNISGLWNCQIMMHAVHCVCDF